MFVGLIILFTAAVAVDLFVSVAVIYHLKQYTLPGWTAANIVISLYLFLSLALFVVAALFFLQIPWSSYPTLPELLRSVTSPSP